MNKKRQLKQLVAASVTLLVGWVMLTAAAAPVPGKNKQLSLEVCIAIARKTNPGLSSQTYDVEAAEAKIKEKKGDKLPFISANGTFIRFSESTAPLGETNDYNASVQVTQPLYSGGGLTSSVDKAGFNWKASAFRYDSRLQSLILEVKETYFEVLKQKRLTRVAEKTLKQAETYLEAAKERFRLGVARLGDTIKAEVEVSDAQLNLIKSQNALLTTKARLNKVLGLPVTGPILINDLLENDINYSEINYSKGEIKSLLAMAEKKLPELKEMAMNIQAQQAAVKISRSEFLPTLSAAASYNWNGNSVSNLQRGWNIGLSLDIPVFNGFSRKARVTQQQARLKKLNKEKEELLQQVSMATWVEFLKVKETKERISNSKKHLKNANENLRISEGEYKEGVSSMLELIDARTTYVDAEKTYINVLAEYHTAWARLERRIGVIK